MDAPWLASLLAVAIVSLISLLGIFTLGMSKVFLKRILLYSVSFAAGALLGDSFIHILPEISKEGFSPQIGLVVIAGMLVFFVLEKFVFWQHCHHPATADHPHTFTTMNLVGDALHNLVDGMIIAGSFLYSTELGIVTTIAVVCHEIPQELGDFALLIHGGYSKRKALLANFATSLTSIVGVCIVLACADFIDEESRQTFVNWISAFTAGAFIYIATADLIPELHKETDIRKSSLQILTFLLGVGVMYSFIYFEELQNKL